MQFLVVCMRRNNSRREYFLLSMKILGIDTVTHACSVALSGVDDSIIERYKVEPKGHSESLLKMIEALLDDVAIRIEDLEVVAVDTGPGSFTGIRIGVAAAQGIALALKVPIVGISSLEVLAEGVDSQINAVLPAIDARMGELFWGRLSRNSGSVSGWVWRNQPTISRPSLMPTLEDKEIGVGSGWDEYSESMSVSPKSEIQFGIFPRARSVATIAERVIASGESNYPVVYPQYVRNNVYS